MTDLWEKLKADPLPKVLYGMGSGADKVLAVCREKGVEVSGVFASDGFARGNLFHGMPVTTYAAAREKFGRFTVLLSFATSRPEVLENIRRIAEEAPLYVPDLPVCGETLFDGAFYETNRARFERVRALFADDRSREVFDRVIESKLTGALSPLFEACTTDEEDFTEVLRPETYKRCGDFGAYTGDTARSFKKLCPNLLEIVAVEPDPKSFKKLSEAAKELPLTPVECALWSHEETLIFSASGGRGAALEERPERDSPAAGKQGKTIAVRGIPGDRLFEDKRADFLKFDVEGAELPALKGLEKTILRDRPDLLVSAYHRPEDLFVLPEYINDNFPFYDLYLRRQEGVPAWDLNLLCVSRRDG